MTRLKIKFFSFMLIFGMFQGLALANPQVETSLGVIEGVKLDGVEVFKGIPYAKAPIGELSFAPPVKSEPFTSTYKADQFCPIVPQVSYLTKDVTQTFLPEQNNNYLCLNIYRPANIDPAKKYPVYVWIHGGAYVMGASSEAVYDGSSFARDDVIFVSVNYRLHALGFYTSKTTLKKYGTTGNWGHLDILQSLHWIKENIGSFGGDADNITVGGESAGSFAVSALVISPLAKGLFNRAILESGTIINYPFSSFNTAENHATTMSHGENLRNSIGIIDDSEEGLSTLKTMDPMFLAYNSTYDYNFKSGLSYNYLKPYFDDMVIPSDPYKALKEKNNNPVDILIGYNTDEGMMFSQNGLTVAEFYKAIDNTFGKAKGTKLKALYYLDSNHGVYERQKEFLGDIMFNLGMKIYLENLCENVNAYAYHFDFSPNKELTGVNHAKELRYAFDNLPKNSSSMQKDIATVFHTRLVNFIKTGDPNTDGVKTTLLKWPKYDNEKHYVFKVDTFSTVEKYELLERLDALEQIIFDRKLKESESKTQEELEKSFHEE